MTSEGGSLRDSVTFIHAADLHLGAPFQGLSTDSEAIGRTLAEATYLAWERIVDAALAREVDFVLLAGDLYDAADPSIQSQYALRDQAARLARAGIRLFVVRGNHDPLNGWSANLEMPRNVHVFRGGSVERAEVLLEDDFVCAIYGRSYLRRDETDDFTPGYQRDGRDAIAIGLLHTNVGNNSDYEPYAPSTVGSLCSCGMDYWALGHIHKHGTMNVEPHIVYAGSPQGLNPKETGAHGCCIVTIERGGRVAAFEHLEVAEAVWDSADIDITDATGLDEVESRINSELDRMRASAGRPVVARLRLVGRTPVRADLARAGVLAGMSAEIRGEQATRTPWVWLDRVTDLSSAAIDVDTLSRQPDFAGELVRVTQEIADDEVALAALVGEVQDSVAEKLPGYVPALTSAQLLEAARDRALDLLLSEEGDA